MDVRIPHATGLVAAGTGPAFPACVHRVLVLFCLAAATACGASVVGPVVPIGEPFTLAVGEKATVADTRLVVEFERVSGDSRCPADVVCIQGGDAVVHIRVSTGSSASYELHTGDTARATAAHGAYRISLIELQPYPFSSGPISPNDYRATLSVRRQ